MNHPPSATDNQSPNPAQSSPLSETTSAETVGSLTTDDFSNLNGETLESSADVSLTGSESKSEDDKENSIEDLHDQSVTEASDLSPSHSERKWVPMTFAKSHIYTTKTNRLSLYERLMHQQRDNQSHDESTNGEAPVPSTPTLIQSPSNSSHSTSISIPARVQKILLHLEQLTSSGSVRIQQQQQQQQQQQHSRTSSNASSESKSTSSRTSASGGMPTSKKSAKLKGISVSLLKLIEKEKQTEDCKSRTPTFQDFKYHSDGDLENAATTNSPNTIAKTSNHPRSRSESWQRVSTLSFEKQPKRSELKSAMKHLDLELEFEPKCDYFETSKDVHIYLELPGVKSEDVDVEVTDWGKRVQVTGVVDDPIEAFKLDKTLTNEGVCERNVGRFIRRVNMRVPVDENDSDASMLNGLLHIRIAKKIK
ncbi:UNVERIFIED_CONTAM: hypothetical protein HDU68_008830 [Siphonaria sp. JEL0065]|nr:hypothetical protein HDU68_008830 [Siphonaria sp. JEL0065]